MCYAAKWADSPEIMFSSVHGDGEEIMLNKVHALLCEADVVVHYYGTGFDIPTLNKEFVKHKMEPPTPYQQLDLIRTVRQRFMFASNKLDYVAQFLGLGSKTQHKGMGLWIGCHEGNEKDWRVMERYNKQDVRLLPKLHKALLPWIKNHPNVGLYDELFDRQGNPVQQCPNCGSRHIIKKGTEKSNTQVYDRYKCKGCGTPLRGRTTILPIEKRRVVLTQSKL